MSKIASKRHCIPRICQNCDTEFFVEQYTLNIGQGQCCSVQCANAIKFPYPEDRFWANVQKTDTCWLWTASKDKDRYGKFYVDKVYLRAHVYSYMLHNGLTERPELLVCH